MDNTFSKRLKNLRTSVKLTQAEFAKEIGTTQATLSSYENSDKLPPVDILISIAQKYHVSLDWLCGLTDSNDPKISIVTYSDLINVLSAIGLLENLNATISIEEQYDPNMRHHPAANIKINDQTLVDFFSEWLDVLALCRKSPSGKKLYNIWIKDILDRYNSPIQLNPCKDIEDLPFD